MKVGDTGTKPLSLKDFVAAAREKPGAANTADLIRQLADILGTGGPAEPAKIRDVVSQIPFVLPRTVGPVGDLVWGMMWRLAAELSAEHHEVAHRVLAGADDQSDGLPEAVDELGRKAFEAFAEVVQKVWGNGPPRSGSRAVPVPAGADSATGKPVEEPEVMIEIPEFRCLGIDSELFAVEVLRTPDGDPVLKADEAFARYLEEHFRESEIGRQAAEAVREKARTRLYQPRLQMGGWDRWFIWGEWVQVSPDGLRLPALGILCDVIWKTRLAPALRQESESRIIRPAALSLEDHMGKVERMRPTNVVKLAGEHAFLETPAKHRITAVNPQQALVFAKRKRRGRWPLATVNGHRLVRYYLRRLAREKQADPIRLDFNRLVFEGSWQVVAKLAGLGRGRQAAVDAKDITWILASQEFEFWNGAKGNAVLVEEFGGWRGVKKRLMLTFASAMCPRWEEGVPLVVVPSHLPPLTGKGPTLAAQINLQDCLFGLLRERAAELYQNGMVHIPENDWMLMAEYAGLPKVMIRNIRERIIEPWKDDSEGPAVLVEPEPWHFTLGPAYADDLQHLKEGGWRSHQARQLGRKSAAARRNMGTAMAKFISSKTKSP